ncbi:PepSY domain-containing protein [Virgibacillus soli]|uniref:PepSY domain-containing protein n=1 Tax=Paracerasibacillus soli TaxID=480284 RepID=A0ABU5CR75_9BACI|nr:PepSY domain-containing protein [Virgibacillus soli]MDY0408877.1 PepSY domain-containing protein [Virgibacillus soli]
MQPNHMRPLAHHPHPQHVPTQHMHPQHASPQHMHPQFQQPNWYRQISIEDAIQVARQQVQGQVVKAELEHRGQRMIYEVEIINPQGVKYEVKLDATTGEVLAVELD